MKNKLSTISKDSNPLETNSVIPSKKRNWYKKLDEHFEKTLIIIGFSLFILLINAQVINRYFLPFIEIANITTWTEEVARYLFIWVTYLGVSLTIKYNESIKVETLINKLSLKKRTIINIGNAGLILGFCLYLIYYGSSMVLDLAMTGQSSPALGIPMFIPYAIIPFGFFLIGIRLFQTTFVDIKNINQKDIFYVFAYILLMVSPFILISDGNTTLLLFFYLALFISLAVPIAFALGLSALTTTLHSTSLPISFMPQAAFTSIDDFAILAIPFFVATGIIMGKGSLIKRLLEMADNFVGFLPGGLALVAVITSMFFSAISGSGPATVAAVGTLLIPTMTRQGYPLGFSAALIAAAGAIGVIIPPSTPFIIYGVVAQASIGDLFLAGVVPGILCAFALCLVAYIISKRNGWKGSQKKFNARNTLLSVWHAKLALLIPVLILGGIYGGFMTPTEAAALAVAYGIIVGVFVYKDLDKQKLYEALVQSSVTSSVIIILIAMANIFGRIISVEGITETVALSLTSITTNPILLLLMINVFLLVIGLFLEALAAIVILTPILLPIAQSIGVDPIHFGIIMVFNLAIGFISPPVGVNLFVASSVAKTNIEGIIKKIFPFLFAMLLLLIVFTYLPGIYTWLIGGLY
ncbi:TRAP transporter large permease subunit [uncultured Marinococcus sp.]|uniref:TRAP transporter large permease n=1 Tax=uncultured Marinococcus sp. TaxID=487012 RepID=UPI002623377D|nr:TRAP transporter large permease subunit [uncultured Marinococcus sp.]